MRIRFPNNFEAEYETNVAAGFIALGAREVVIRPAPAVPAGPPQITFFVGYTEMGNISLMAKRSDGEKTYFVNPITPPTWFGQVCPGEVWAEWQIVRGPITEDEKIVAADKYNREKYGRETETKKQAAPRGEGLTLIGVH